ncbi:MAG TPA: ABC transporter permease [Actinospica sp.]|jgi:lipooligosaccharide transport system permease protein|nr:ABC transporter permease [Actinospica sp.]
MTTSSLIPPGIAAPPPNWTVGRAFALVERNIMMYRRSITPLAFGLIEPVMYLLTIGFGVGALVGTVPGVNVRYAAFVAPAILATTAMNTAFNQTSSGVFFRVKVDGTYEAIVPTPLSPTDIAVGEVASAVINGLLTSIGFLAAAALMGLVVSPGILLAIPASALVGFAFATGGLAVTTYVRDFPDFQLVQLVMLPMYLFATTFYPLSTYPGWLRPLIEALPLYQSIELIREPALGRFPATTLAVAILYLACFGAASMALATRRLGRLLLK